MTGLREDELRALLISTDGTLATDLGMGEAYRLGRLKLQAAQAKRFEPSVEILQTRVLIDSRWWWHEESADAFLAPLQAAVFGNEVIEAEYDHYDGSSRRGRLEPHGIVAKSGLWYLVARRDGALRSYRVSRFRSVLRTAERFKRSEGFDIRTWWPANEKRFAAEFSSFRLILALSEEGLRLIRRIVPGRVKLLQRESGRRGWRVAEVGVDSALYGEFVVLCLGGDCRLLEPNSLAKAVAARARATLAALAARKTS